MAKLEYLCKNAAEIKKLYKEQYLDKKHLIGSESKGETFSIGDALYIIEKLELMAQYGEKDATYQELEPYFLADEFSHREIIRYETPEEHFGTILDELGEDKKKRFIENFTRCGVWKPAPVYGDYILLSSEIHAEHKKLWEKKDLSYEEGMKYINKARDEFRKEYNIPDDYYERYSIYKKRDQWELSRCKEPQPKTTYRVDRTFKFENESDVIITDPCYIYHWVGNNHDEWTCDNIDSSRDTLYGDWSCSLFECEKGKFPANGTKPFGSFCADAGLVCVEDIKNNPQKDEILKWANSHSWCASIINNFVGTIEYQIRTDYYPKNAKWNPSESLIIYGYGKKDGKDFAFATCQTGF